MTETAAHSGGNIIQGYEGYLKNAPGGRRKYEVSEADRIFSSSSATYKKVCTSFVCAYVKPLTEACSPSNSLVKGTSLLPMMTSLGWPPPVLQL